MIKNLCWCFCTRTQYSFILNYSGFWEGADGGGLSEWNLGKVIEIS